MAIFLSLAIGYVPDILARRPIREKKHAGARRPSIGPAGVGGADGPSGPGRAPRQAAGDRRHARDRPAGRRDADADQPRPRDPLLQRLRLFSPDSLHAGPEAAARHPRRLRGRGRQGLHLPPAPRAPLVGRRALHRRGLPLLLGGRRPRQGSVVRRTGRPPVGRRGAAEARGAGSADGALLLVQAQPVLYSGVGLDQPASCTVPPTT